MTRFPRHIGKIRKNRFFRFSRQKVEKIPFAYLPDSPARQFAPTETPKFFSHFAKKGTLRSPPPGGRPSHYSISPGNRFNIKQLEQKKIFFPLF